MTDFLLELRSEEIPARMQAGALVSLETLFLKHMNAADIAVDAVTVWSTPRRLTLIAHNLPIATHDKFEDIKGPRIGAPQQALEGFLRKTGLTNNNLSQGDGVWLARVKKPGRPMQDILAEAIPAIIRAFPWPKSMRWGAASASTESLRWVRPLQGIVALLGDAVVPCQLVEISAGSTTTGHRFMGQSKIPVRPEPVEGLPFSERGEEQDSASTSSARTVFIGNALTYAADLRAAHVIVDQDERRAIIREGAEAAASAAGLVLVPDEGLVAENAGLTEWPVPMLGRFDPAFLDVPEEVIQLTARVNQKYFICRDSAGKLANAFVCTANLEPSDGGATVIAGNEKVLAARLSDAKFFWEADLKVRLEDQAAKLSQIVFHEKLGTVADKVERVAKLARWLVESGVVTTTVYPERSRRANSSEVENPNAEESLGSARHSPSTTLGNAALADQAETAARLCKADLVTGMVGEFPELQGIMGGYYARAQGHGDAVADAIRDHYKPVGQGDDVPTAPVTVAVSLADKLDTIVGFFGRGMPPSGSKDPFALRRAALGLIALWVGNGLRVTLRDLLEGATASYRGTIAPNLSKALGIEITPFSDELYEQLQTFFADRLKVQQREAGVRHDLIDAVFVLGGEDDLVRLLARVKALQAFVGTDAGANLLAGYKRAGNILKASEGTEQPVHPERSRGTLPSGAEAFFRARVLDFARTRPSTSLRMNGVEVALEQALDTAEPLAAAAIAREDFEGAMSALSTLRAPIDAFFEGVMVNDSDPQKRAYRIGLLERFVSAVHRVADFSKIEG